MTTVVITHDLSQITSGDFVYVLKNGYVVEQGYRYDLETTNRGEFRMMMDTQGAMGGFPPVKAGSKLEKEREDSLVLDWKHLSRARPDSRFVPWSSGIFSNVPDLPQTPLEPSRISRFIPPEAFGRNMPFDHEFDAEQLNRSAYEASRRRPAHPMLRTRWDDPTLTPVEVVTIDLSEIAEKPQSFWSLIRDLYPTVPYKFLVLFGIVISLLNGAMTPIFSFLLSRLIFEVSIGASHSSVINLFGGIVLGVSALDGVFLGLKYTVMETAAAHWVTNMRKISYKLILSQDKKWFDKSENSPVRLVQMLIKDGDDAGNLISAVLGQCCVVVAMLCVGMIWAFIMGWQLTLVGVAIVPVFGVVMAVQTNLVARCELRNKRAREDVGKNYYQVRTLYSAFVHYSLEIKLAKGSFAYP
jgi:ATP-binding cassette, subfamily B (MDR/TAP), member 1